jgi:methionine aminopeptidase
MIIRKSPAELEKMRKAGMLVCQILATMRGMIQEGVSTLELEVVAEKMIRTPERNRRSRVTMCRRQGASSPPCSALR